MHTFGIAPADLGAAGMHQPHLIVSTRVAPTDEKSPELVVQLVLVHAGSASS